MRRVDIKYDPYEMVTEFKIDGTSVLDTSLKDSWLDKALKPGALIPLQSWIDPVLSEKWDGLVSFLEATNDDTFEISFCGRKSDFDDLKNSLNQQNKDRKSGLHLQFPEDRQKFIMDDSEMKKAIDEVVDIMAQPQFASLVSKSENQILKDQYAAMKKNIDSINNKEFRVVFTGTYSVGKSTVINALIGKNILPNSESSCTDKICYIKHDASVKYARVKYVLKHHKVEEHDCKNADEAHEWIVKASEKEGLFRIEVYVDMSHLSPKGIGNDFKLVFVDTPGTGSEEGENLAKRDGSQTHLELTKQILRSDQKEMVVLVSDKKTVSTGITEILDIFENSAGEDRGCYNDRFLFVLNQCDTYSYHVKNKDSTGRYEGLENEVLKYKKTISTTSHGTIQRNIANPRVFPLSAAVALAVKMGYNDANHKPKRETEERSYYDAYDDFCEKLTDHRAEYYVNHKISDIDDSDVSMNYMLDYYSDLPLKEKEQLRIQYDCAEDTDSYFLLHSGILSLETAITSYIEKYAFPIKMRKILRTFKSILIGINEENTFYLDELEHQKAMLEGKSNEIKKEKANKSKEENKKGILDAYMWKLNQLENSVDAISLDLPELDKIRAKYYQIQEESYDFFERRSDGSLVENITLEDAEKIKNKIEKKVRVLTDEAADQVRLVQIRKTKEADEIAKKFNKYIKDLKGEGLLDIEGFHIQNTVQYQNIMGDGRFLNYDVYVRDIDNPDKEHIEMDDGILNFFVSIGRSLKTILEPDKVNRVDASKYWDKINSTLDKHVTNLIKDVEKAYKKDIFEIQNNMKKRSQAILQLIEATSNTIKKRKEKISRDVRTENGYKAKKAELEKNCEFLMRLIYKIDAIKQEG